VLECNLAGIIWAECEDWDVRCDCCFTSLEGMGWDVLMS
jgi:hypothetical protein